MPLLRRQALLRSLQPAPRRRELLRELAALAGAGARARAAAAGGLGGGELGGGLAQLELGGGELLLGRAHDALQLRHLVGGIRLG